MTYFDVRIFSVILVVAAGKSFQRYSGRVLSVILVVAKVRDRGLDLRKREIQVLFQKPPQIRRVEPVKKAQPAWMGTSMGKR